MDFNDFSFQIEFHIPRELKKGAIEEIKEQWDELPELSVYPFRVESIDYQVHELPVASDEFGGRWCIIKFFAPDKKIARKIMDILEDTEEEMSEIRIIPYF